MKEIARVVKFTLFSISGCCDNLISFTRKNLSKLLCNEHRVINN